MGNSESCMLACNINYTMAIGPKKKKKEKKEKKQFFCEISHCRKLQWTITV